MPSKKKSKVASRKKYRIRGGRTKKNNKKPVSATVYFFHLNGCGHCEHLKPIWNNVVKNFNNKNSNIAFKEVESSEIKNLPKNINIMLKAETIVGYPDVRILTSNGKVSKFEGNRTMDEISIWINKNSR